MRREAPLADPFLLSRLSAADLGAGIAGHAIKLARLYLQRGQMFSNSHGEQHAAADWHRAEEAYRWAIEAAHAVNPAGRDLLTPLLIEIRTELDSLTGKHHAGVR